ncbi:metallophosphoesterase [Bacillus sp. FJAT-27916]|uniref:metallophosphoesterase family protein n=1 Tax=Bacillaceae TaxID=186817 RepID=UPI000671795F|nr:DNA repair exonuclease [Bacillus sp. FJAT-27916]KMY45182.1 metallophosphoesterase [Bacillus sp. FJAT-27916]
MDFTFIHAADIHLDSPLKGLSRYEGAPVGRLRSATREAFTNLVDLAIERQVDFIIIAGDLYDGDWKDYNTGLYFASEMARLQKEQIPVFMIKGNHDAASVITKEIKLPDNVHMFDVKKCGSVKLDDIGVVIHGQGFSTRAVLDNLVKGYPNSVDGYYNIGILHTSAGGREGHENYAPCSIEDMKGKGYDYWALGHIHKREYLSEKEPVILFPGNIQSRHSKETGPKGCTLVEVEGGTLKDMTHMPLDVLRWEVIDADLTGVTQYEEWMAQIEQEIEKAYDLADGRMLALRFILNGQTPLHFELASDRDRVLNDLRSMAFSIGNGDIWIEKVKLKTTALNSLSEASNSTPVTGILEWLDDMSYEEMLQEIKEEFQSLHNALPMDLKRGDEPVIPDTADALREKIQAAKDIINEGLLMDRGKHS